MKDVFLMYDSCCVYEIAVLNLFMQLTGSEAVICSPDGEKIRTREGFSVNADCALADIDLSEVRSFFVTGGNIKAIDTAGVMNTLTALHKKGVLIGGICAGVDMLDKAGILENIRSTHSEEEDCVRDGCVLTSRANAYVDFAIEAARALNLFKDEADELETIEFWKNHKRIQ